MATKPKIDCRSGVISINYDLAYFL